VNSTPDLTIVILNFNTQFWLQKTLDTLKLNFLDKTAYKVEVVVVDNNSSDDSVQIIKKDFSWVKLIKNADNIGYAAGNNIALKKAKSKYVMLLNSDVEFTNESNLDVLLDYLDNNSQVGVITPAVRLVNGSLDPACHRGEPTLWASFTYFSGLEALFPSQKLFSDYHQLYQDISQIHQIDACSGAAMIIRTNVIKQVGYLDERFFMYAEDLDWCKRIREAGSKVVFHPHVSLIHHKYKSGLSSVIPEIASKTTHHFYDTMLQYYDKHYHSHHPKIIRGVLKQIINLKKGSK
jgi:GT2 family glycosyltransferase